MMLFDGKDLTLSTPQSHVYAQLPKPGTIDQAVVFFGAGPTYAAAARGFAADDSDGRIDAGGRCGSTTSEKDSILGKPAHHLAGRTESVDYQVWVADGEQPLLMRVVLTYPTEARVSRSPAPCSLTGIWRPRWQDSVFASRRHQTLEELPSWPMPRAANASAAKVAVAGARDKKSKGMSQPAKPAASGNQVISKSALLTVSISAALFM